MAGFTTVDAVNTAWVAGKGQRIPFCKIFPSTAVSSIPHTSFLGTGTPGAGTTGTKGRANGRVLTSASAGAIQFNNATSGANTYINSIQLNVKTGAQGTYILVDRIADCNVDHSEATGNFTGLTATSRLPSASTSAASGCMIYTEVTTAFSAASNNITYTYTNTNGTASQVTPTIATTASAIVGRSINGNLWQPLATGDCGVRSIESITLSSGSATGAYNVCLVRVIAMISTGAANQPAERDYCVETPMMERIYDDSCLMWLTVAGAASTYILDGNINVVSA